jgi:tetratricopeptide (TPR) repeat protein
MNNLALLDEAQGKYAQAEALCSQVLEISGPGKTQDISALYFVSCAASLYQREGKYDLAQTYLAQVLAGYRRTLGSESPDTMEAAANLALAYLSQGKFAEGEPLAREAVETVRKKSPEDWRRFRAESVLGSILAGQKKYAEAEPLLLEGYRGPGPVLPGSPPRMGRPTL